MTTPHPGEREAAPVDVSAEVVLRAGEMLIGVLGAVPAECDLDDDQATCLTHNAEWSTRNGRDLGHCEWIEARMAVVPEWHAAAPHNAKTERYYTLQDNGLEKSWAGERVWCNPPYSDIRPWVQKAWDEWVGSQAIVMLLPANRTEQGWWQDLVEPRRDRRDDFRCEFLRGRRRFIQQGRDTIEANERPPFGLCLLIWSGWPA